MKVILDLCAGTGAWSQPYVDNGYYDVKRITLPHYDVRHVTITKTHIVFHSIGPLLLEDIKVKLTAVHGILAAPPCTEFSRMRNYKEMGLYPKWAEGLVAVRACEDIIRACMCRGWTKFWALENPVGQLQRFLGRPRFSFEQWHYGDFGLKPTYIWGYHNEPKQTHFDRPELADLEAVGASVRASKRPVCPPEYADLGLDRAAIRAITPSGFAQAFYKANR